MSTLMICISLSLVSPVCFPGPFVTDSTCAIILGANFKSNPDLIRFLAIFLVEYLIIQICQLYLHQQYLYL